MEARALQISAAAGDTLAKVGSEVVTARELTERLELMPFPRKEKPSQRDSVIRRGLLGLIAEKVLANEAQRLGIMSDSISAPMRGELEDMLVRDELYRREVTEKVGVSEKEIKIGLRRLAEERKVIAIMTESEPACRAVSDSLQHKAPRSSVLQTPGIREIDTITVNFGTMDVRAEELIYQVPLHKTTKPFYSDESGWAIFYILEARPSPIAIKEDAAARRKRAEKIIRHRKERDAAVQYYYRYLGSMHAEGDSSAFNLLADSLSALWKSDTLRFHRRGAYQFSSDLVDVLRDRLKGNEGMTVVRTAEGNMDLDRVLEMFRHEDFASKEYQGPAFRDHLNETVKSFAARYLLAVEGRRRNLQFAPRVQSDLRCWTDYWSGGALYNKKKAELSISDADSAQSPASARRLERKHKTEMDKYIARLAHDQNLVIYFDRLRDVSVSPIQMFTRRYLGFGGTMTAVPLLRFQWEWYKVLKRQGEELP